MFKNVRNDIGVALRITVLITVVTGVFYPLVITGVAQVAFNNQANGSLVTDSHGSVVGSELIGQCFYKTSTDQQGNVTYVTTKDDQGNAIFAIDPRYFQSRPSFTVDASTGNPLPCNAANSVGSNLGPTSQTLITRVKGYTDYLYSMGVARDADGSREPMPVELVTGDFTGFDPGISEAGALAQADMVAAARHLGPARVRQAVDDHLNGRSLAIFGAPYVNVLDLNRALDGGAAG